MFELVDYIVIPYDNLIRIRSQTIVCYIYLLLETVPAKYVDLQCCAGVGYQCPALFVYLSTKPNVGTMALVKHLMH